MLEGGEAEKEEKEKKKEWTLTVSKGERSESIKRTEQNLVRE